VTDRKPIHRMFPDAHTVDCKLHSPTHVIRAEAKIPEQLWNFLCAAIPLNERFTQSELRELDMLRDRILARGKPKS
jgi:hypothetical protein